MGNSLITYMTHNHTQYILQCAHMYTNFHYVKNMPVHIHYKPYMKTYTTQNRHIFHIRHTLHQTYYTHRLIGTDIIMCYTHIVHILNTNTLHIHHSLSTHYNFHAYARHTQNIHIQLTNYTCHIKQAFIYLHKTH